MSVISVVNLKGGVGKTAVVINTAHAFSKRFCETLVVDLDVQGDASQLLSPDRYIPTPWQSDMRTGEFAAPPSVKTKEDSGLGESRRLERILQYCRENIIEVRPNLSLLPLQVLLNLLPQQAKQDIQSGPIGRDLGVFGPLLAKIIHDIGFQYDHVIVDTPPNWSGIHEFLLPLTDLALIPVDPSEMSVRAAIQLLNQATLHTPVCSLLVRTLVSKKATSIAKLTEKKLQGEFLSETSEDLNPENPPKRVMLRGISSKQGKAAEIYLSGTPIYRSELVHKLTYLKKTVFESRELGLLQSSYMQLAKEIEKVLAADSLLSEDRDDDTFQFAFG